MPYIGSKCDRERIDTHIAWLTDGGFIFEKGNLNYFLCKLFLSNKMSYEHARNFIGEMENAKLEIQRRWIAPYEDKKCEEHGDVL